MDLILSTLNSGLVLLDPEMTVVWANKMIWEIFPGQNLLGKKCYAVAENRTTPCEDCQSILAFKDGNIHQREFQNNLRKRWHRVIAFPIKDEKGKVINVLESTTDIDDNKRAEISRDKAIKELKALKKKIEEENIYLKNEVREAHLFTDIIGSSNALLYVLGRVEQVAETDSTVLINGDTGVGKELIARAIHAASPRSSQPFISINCSALPSSLIESELFGHERGAFTDAQYKRKGRFELADQGTLFLDEVGELPMEAQAKLLRVLEDGQFQRVGGEKTLRSNTRILLATNRDMKMEVSSGRFRSDLYYRINVFLITVPPLQKRKEDIPLLVEHFVNFFNKKFGRSVEQISESDMDLLQQYSWPGNVRELKNIIERIMISSTGTKLSLKDMAGLLPTSEDLPQKTDVLDISTIHPLEDVERNHIRKALDATEWRVDGLKGAARILKINPSTLRSRMKKLGLRKPQS